MLLVDDREREPRQRRVHGEARADDERRVAGRRRLPVVEPLAAGKAAVQRGDAHAGKRGGEPSCELRREVDLGHEQEHLSAARDRASRGGGVDVGLAASGHALQKRDAEATGRGADGRERGALRVVHLGAARGGGRWRFLHPAGQSPRGKPAAVGRGQRRDRRPVDALARGVEPRVERGERGRAREARRERLPAGLRQRERGGRRERSPDAACADRRHREREGESRRLAVVRRDELGEREHILGQRRQRQHVVDRLHAITIDARRRLRADNHAHAAPSREPDAHERPARDPDAIRRPVVERLRRRGRDSDADAGHRPVPAHAARAAAHIVVFDNLMTTGNSSRQVLHLTGLAEMSPNDVDNFVSNRLRCGIASAGRPGPLRNPRRCTQFFHRNINDLRIACPAGDGAPPFGPAHAVRCA